MTDTHIPFTEPGAALLRVGRSFRPGEPAPVCRDSWMAHVTDGIITRETRQTNPPSVGPDRPGNEPRGCPYRVALPPCPEHRTGLGEEPETSAEEIEEMYRPPAIAEHEDRCVTPTAAVGDARRLGYDGDPGMGGDGPFGHDSGRRLPPTVSVPNFHGLRKRQMSDDPADAEEA